METKTHVKVGRITPNQNQTLVQRQGATVDLKIKTRARLAAWRRPPAPAAPHATYPPLKLLLLQKPRVGPGGACKKKDEHPNRLFLLAYNARTFFCTVLVRRQALILG